MSFWFTKCLGSDVIGITKRLLSLNSTTVANCFVSRHFLCRTTVLFVLTIQKQFIIIRSKHCAHAHSLSLSSEQTKKKPPSVVCAITNRDNKRAVANKPTTIITLQQNSQSKISFFPPARAQCRKIWHDHLTRQEKQQLLTTVHQTSAFVFSPPQMRVVGSTMHHHHQYNTLGRSTTVADQQRSNASSSSTVSHWFSSLRRTPKKTKVPSRSEVTSRSAWDLSVLEKSVRRAVG